MPKVIAVYEDNKLIGYVKSSMRKDLKKLSLVGQMWNCKTYLNEQNAQKTIDIYKNQGLDYDFRVEDFEI